MHKQLFYNNRTNWNGDDVNEKHKERKSNLDMKFLNRLPIHIASYAFDCTINAFKRFYNRS